MFKWKLNGVTVNSTLNYFYTAYLHARSIHPM